MKKYLIKWDCGYGETVDVVEAQNEDDASTMAYERWREEAEDYAEYSAQLLNKENAEDYGLESELEDEN